jgi:4'-phosphopantetheinyl transferase
LSKYTGTPPGQLSFNYNAYGKPEVVERCNDVPLRFSLSRSEGLVVCAVTLNNDIGIDVEDTKQPVEAVDIAAHFFSETEKQSLLKLPEASVTREFFRYWTLKESYIKALGVGLSLSLDSFSFDIADPENIKIFFDDKTPDHPDSWKFFQYCLAEDYILAISAKIGSKEKIQVKIGNCVPL